MPGALQARIEWSRAAGFGDVWSGVGDFPEFAMTVAIFPCCTLCLLARWALAALLPFMQLS